MFRRSRVECICTRTRLHMQITRVFRISGTAGRIALKFGVWLETNQLDDLHQSGLGYICTCARTYLFSVSQERQNGFR